jgi:3-methyladenine DNA glycosylase AlkD
MGCADLIRRLKSLSNPKNVEGMSRFGINPRNALGVSIPDLRDLAKDTGKSHRLAQDLWSSGIHEARILAAMLDEPDRVTEKQMDSWIKDFDSWDVCDQVCMNLFDRTPFAFGKAIEWSSRKPEFEKRAGFSLMACLAVHDKKSRDSDFIKFFPAIKAAATDERNYVKKTVNWALRQIGKRKMSLNKMAVKTAAEMLKTQSKSARWVASDAMRELTSSAVLARLKKL